MLGGELIYQTSDEYGAIEIVDYINEIRTLHFGNKTQQSSCLLCNPYFLIHKYAQAMILPLCWLQTRRVLVLGMGAGSIVKYLHNYHPNLIIDAIELRSSVIDIANEFFMLPEPDERLNIINDSAANWLNKTSKKNYDLIIVDVFLTSDSGSDITVNISPMLNKIYNMLSSNGVAVFNHLNNNVRTYPGFESLYKIFNNKLYSIDIESTNSILLASRGNIPDTINNSVFKKMSDISTLPYQIYFDLMKKL